VSGIVTRLSPRHVALGWPLFWRIHGPYWVELGYLSAVVWGGWVLMESALGERLAIHVPWLGQHYEIAVMAGVAVIYAVGRPGVRVLCRVLDRRWESTLWRSQYAVMEILHKACRGLTAILAVLGMIFYAAPEEWGFRRSATALAGAVFAGLSLAAVALTVGLLGWFKEQYDSH
jgi:hypothetical protein